ncbi:MAG: 6,7-dimethyl-8-ribityllumazine synthase [Bdellovibrionales bacterium]|nr:6,7-dimethyl-8-ribityllumazine synthase [Bdellovibrionales bacterium]
MQKEYDTKDVGQVPGANIAILQAAWHSEHTDRMVSACREILESAQAVVNHQVVPGSYELPLAAKLLAKTSQFEAIVVFGAVVRGETDHYKVIVDTCIREFGRIMYDFEVPIIMELMPVHDIQHLIARSTGRNNKGIEAAQAAIEMISWKRQLPA